jgi:hypothetical protein
MRHSLDGPNLNATASSDQHNILGKLKNVIPLKARCGPPSPPDLFENRQHLLPVFESMTQQLWGNEGCPKERLIF